MNPRVLVVVCVFGVFAAMSASAQEVVLHSSDVTTVRGNWARVSSSTGAGGQTMSSEDRRWSSPDAPLASPADFFEARFTAQAYTPYRIWLRVRARNDSKWNESVWVQFNDSLNASGNAAYRIGTASAVLMNLEQCNGCGVSNWGWTGGSHWIGLNQQVQFPSSGTKTIRVQTREDGADIDQIVLSPLRHLTNPPGSAKNDTTVLAQSGGGTWVSNTPKTLPATIQAQDFDSGANGTAYYDRTAGNNGGQYRSGDVDIERTSDSSGTYNVGWIDAGEWLNYTVSVPSAGSYTLELRVASPNGSSARVRFGGTDVTGALSIPATGGWQSWRTVQRTVTLPAGTQVMRVQFDASGANFNWIRVSQGGSGGSAGPFGGHAWAVPGTIQAEDFDLGGQNVGYYDNTPGNTGGKYRSTDVDVEASSVGYNVGWVSAGEWLNYTVNVSSAGTYTLTARVASPGTGGTFHVEFGGVNKTGTLNVPNTGGWQAYRDVTASVSLSAGTQVMRVRMTRNASTGAVGNFDYLRVTGGSTSNRPPAVSLTGPTNGATFSAPRTMSLAANASDTDGTIARVEFYVGSTLIASDTTSPYTASWNVLTAGTYTLTARATDNSGATTTSTSVTVTANPTRAAFTPPSDHSTAVISYLLEIYASGATPGSSAPARSQNIGKPSVINGEITADITAVLQPLSPGSYFATMSAVRASGSTRSAASNTFSR